MKTRGELLEKLLNLHGNVTFFAQELQEYPWDIAQPLAMLTRGMVVQVLERFVRDEFDANTLEEWANLIEGREDIAFERVHKDAISEAIFQLANPLLTVELTKQSVSDLAKKLSN